MPPRVKPPAVPSDSSNGKPAAPPTKPAEKPEPSKPARKIVHPKLKVVACLGDDALTEARCKELLGWEEETDKVKFGPDFQMEYQDEKGKWIKVRFKNSSRNREYVASWGLSLSQEHLQKRWKVNGETVVIGETGEVISGQHRLASVPLANVARRRDKYHWEVNWPGEVTMECIIVYGVKEDDSTVNTVDTGRPRSLGDVLYRSEFFATFPPKDRRPMARMGDHCTRMLWSRTGIVKDAFAPTRTHAEALDFLKRHRRLIDAIQHVYSENDGSKISKFVSPGYASALLYLMATSASDLDKYKGNLESPPDESRLDLSFWDKATEFWTLFAGDAAELREVRHAIAALTDPDTGKPLGGIADKIGILAKAWALFSKDEKITESGLELERSAPDGDGFRTLINPPLFGGIDQGSPRDGEQIQVSSASPAEEGDGPGEHDPSPEEIAAAKEKLKAERTQTMTLADQLRKDLTTLREKNPGTVLFFKNESANNYVVWQPDAMPVALAQTPPGKVKKHPPTGMMQTVVDKAKFAAVVETLGKTGKKSAVVLPDNSVHPVAEEKPKPAPVPTKPKPTPKPGLRGGTN